MANSIDLFCGAGGLTEGLHRAGWSTRLGVDFDPQAVETFAFNHSCPGLHADLRAVSSDELLEAAALQPGTVDLVAGGPPCQGFSMAGRRLSDDPKNRLFLEFVRLVEGLQPRAVLFENVPGIVSMDSGRVVDAIRAEFTRIGYRVKDAVLDCADYGVPQHRRRYVLIGTAGFSPDTAFPLPSHGPPPDGESAQMTMPIGKPRLPWVTAWDALSDLPVLRPGEGNEELQHSGSRSNQFQRERQGRRAPGLIFNHRATNHSDRIQRRYALMPEGGDGRSIPAEQQTKKNNYWRIDRTRPSRTVTCNHRTDIIHPVMPRGTTVREAARLQSFDDDYRFFGNLTRKAKHVTQDDQAGNAVPPVFAEALGRALISSLSVSSERVSRPRADAHALKGARDGETQRSVVGP